LKGQNNSLVLKKERDITPGVAGREEWRETCGHIDGGVEVELSFSKRNLYVRYLNN
jgi:hypothetical protein